MTSSWTGKPLGEIMTLQRGFDLPKKERREGQVPIISSSGAEDFHAVAAKQGPGVVTGRYGTIGKVFYSEEPYWPLNTTLFVSNFQGNNPRYCYYLLSQLNFHEHSGKTGVPGVNRNDLHTVEMLTTTDTRQQETIAEALSDADALIEGLERLIAKKRLIKQGAMQDLLTAKRRLPGFSGEWVETTFGQCFQFLRTGSASRSQLGTSLGVGYIHYGDIHGMKSAVLDLSRTRLPEIKPEQVATLSRVQDGDLVIADASEDIIDVGKSVEIRGVGSAEVVAGLHTFLLRGNREIVADGFKAYIQFLSDVRAGIESIATGSSVYGISKKNLAGLRLRVPPIQEQTAIGEVFSDMDAEILALETRLEKARQVKEGMMQNLLTGRIRLV